MASGVICEYCGGLNDPRRTNCSNCGAPLPAATVAPQPQPQHAQTPPPPPYRPQPVPPRRPGAGTGCALAGCGLLAVIFILFIVGVFSSMGSNSGTTPAKPAPLGKHAVISLHGSASTKTSSFQVNRYWDYVWSYNCENRAGQPEFNVRAHLIGDPDLLDRKLEQHATSGNGRDHFERSGTYFLTVKTHCRWAIKVLDDT